MDYYSNNPALKEPNLLENTYFYNENPIARTTNAGVVEIPPQLNGYPTNNYPTGYENADPQYRYYNQNPYANQTNQYAYDYNAPQNFPYNNYYNNNYPGNNYYDYNAYNNPNSYNSNQYNSNSYPNFDYNKQQQQQQPYENDYSKTDRTVKPKNKPQAPIPYKKTVKNRKKPDIDDVYRVRIPVNFEETSSEEEDHHDKEPTPSPEPIPQSPTPLPPTPSPPPKPKTVRRKTTKQTQTQTEKPRLIVINRSIDEKAQVAKREPSPRAISSLEITEINSKGEKVNKNKAADLSVIKNAKSMRIKRLDDNGLQVEFDVEKPKSESEDESAKKPKIQPMYIEIPLDGDSNSDWKNEKKKMKFFKIEKKKPSQIEYLMQFLDDDHKKEDKKKEDDKKNKKAPAKFFKILPQKKEEDKNNKKAPLEFVNILTQKNEEADKNKNSDKEDKKRTSENPVILKMPVVEFTPPPTPPATQPVKAPEPVPVVMPLIAPLIQNPIQQPIVAPQFLPMPQPVFVMAPPQQQPLPQIQQKPQIIYVKKVKEPEPIVVKRRPTQLVKIISKKPTQPVDPINSIKVSEANPTKKLESNGTKNTNKSPRTTLRKSFNFFSPGEVDKSPNKKVLAKKQT